MRTSLVLEIQQWNDQLVICIPEAFAKSKSLSPGQSVLVQIAASSVSDAPSLEQNLAHYDVEKYGGEVMSAPLIGTEIIR
jgi:antitoxin component of MazEF toxin-antitoxin module